MEDEGAHQAVHGPLRAARPGGRRRLAGLIARYGKAIERDLQRIYGLDLGTEWRARRWRKLLNLIDGLPRNSAFIEAISSDEQWAERVLEDPPAEKPPRQRMSDWSPELERLTDLYDRVGELIRVVIATGGGKPKRLTPAPRPVTALERVRNRKRERQHRSLVARMLPHKAPGV